MLLFNNFLLLFFFLGIFYSGKLLNNFFFFNLEKNLIFYFSIVLFLIGSFINISFFFNLNNTYVLKFIFYIFISLSIINIKDLILKIKGLINLFLHKEKKNNYNYLLACLVFILFLLSFLPSTDPDSLDYHLGAANKWLIDDGFYEDYFWLNYRLIGYGEFLNYFGLLLNIQNFGSITQFLYLLIFCHYLNKNNIFKKSQIDERLIYLSIASMPVILSLIFTQKFFLVPCLIVISAIIHFEKNFKEPEKLNFFFIISSIYFSFLIKINFLVYFLLFSLIFLKFINTKLFLKIISYNIIFLIIISPFYLRNYYFYGDPISPFLEFLKINPDSSFINFANFLRGYETDMSSIFSVIKTIFKNFIPFDPNHLTTFFGIFLFYLFFSKKSNNSILYLYIGILLLIVHMLIGQFSSRYLLVAIIIISIYFLINFKKNLVLNYLVITQTCVVIIFSFYPIYNFFLNADKYQSDFAYEYNETKWLNLNMEGKEYISDIRSVYFLGNNHIKYLNYLEQSSEKKEIRNNRLKNFIIENNIDYISLKSFTYDQFKSGYQYINDCFFEIKKSKFEIKTRKPIFMRNLDSKFLTRRIFKRKHDVKNC